MKTFNDVGDLLFKQKWIFAKTMPENPHEYTLRKNWDSDSNFVDAVNFIRNFGYVEYFAGRPYTYLDVNGFRHWTMGAPVAQTTLINRRQQNYQSEYNLISETYDSLFLDSKYDTENRAVLSLIGDITNRSILDIGCGTGLFLDYENPSNYIGIDVSKGMLRKLIEKHPDRKDSIQLTPFSSFASKLKFDLIIALFGSASYLSRYEIERIPQFLSNTGEAFLMFYKKGYMPVTYEKTRHMAKPISFADELNFPFIDFTNYSVVRIKM